MKKYLFFTLCILFFNCSKEKAEDTVAQKDTLSVITPQTDSASYAEHYEIDVAGTDSIQVSKLKFYATTWDASYFPIPTIATILTESDEDPLYAYLIEHFDTLSERVSTENYETRGAEQEESIAESCAWEQKFKSNISFSSSRCSESGEFNIVKTHCPDKKVVVRLVDILFQSNENHWNSDSTKYTPIEEEAGCYYSIKKNDAGHYTIEYYCGC